MAAGRSTRETLAFSGFYRIKTPLPSSMRRFFALFSLLVVSGAGLRAQSPYESSADFAKYAMKLREQALLKVEPQVFVPTTSRTSMTRFPWKTNIVTTVFWVGEQPTANNPVPNTKSSWDGNWRENFGGYDNPDPSARRNFIPAAFVPRQNPFYVALPYNDVSHGRFKPEARLVIPWFKQAFTAGRPVGLQRPMARHSQGQQDLLCAMGGLRPVPDGSFPIRLPKRAAEAEFEPWRGAGRFAGGAGLPRTRADRRDRLAIRRGARHPAGSLA